MVTLSPGQVILSVYMWISMSLYLYVICKLLQWRRKIDQFKSSYYLLFLLQSAADFYVFVFVEIIMRPRKLNYFGVFSEKMRVYAFFSMANVLTAETILCCGHILIALNRFTTFHMPVKHEKIWTKTMAITSFLSLWTLSILTALPGIIIYHESPRLVLLPNGVLQLYLGKIHVYNSYQTRSAYLFTVVVCSILYICSYQKARKSKIRNTKVERRLLLCAIASSFPFCIELVRATLECLSSQHKNDAIYIWVAEFWFYEMGIMATISVWMQLLINKNVRHLIFRRFFVLKKGINPASTVISKF